MAEGWKSRTSEDIGRFRQQLQSYDEKSLRLLFKYYREDLNYILQTLETESILEELHSRKVINPQNYLRMRDEWKTDTFSKRLLEDVMSSGRDAVIGFWECLFVLRKCHPNILAVVEEITNTGKRLVEKILSDERGHKLSLELRDLQIKHKQHLLKETQTLVEPRSPGFTLKAQKFPINERYVKLSVVSIDLFKEHIWPNRLFSWSHQSQCVPHAVMVSGVPGIGKTTLMKKIVYDWVNGELYQRFAFVFFFKFRELNKLGKVSLEKMILQQYPHLESQIGNILKHPEILLFLFDGLDESIHQIDFNSSRITSDPKQRQNLGVIVDSLVRHRLLMGCSVLITSRPTRLASINTKDFQRMAEINGFHHRDQLIYFEHFFRNKELSEKAFHYVQENDTLHTFCYIPSYCWIVCTVLSMCFRAQPTTTGQLMASLPKTVTQLFVTFVCNILANHKKDSTATTQDLISIGRMAEHGLMNHMTVFDSRHLDSFSVITDNDLFSCLMMESGRPPDLDYTFLQLALQEFLAAFFHFINYNPDKLQESLDRAESYKDGQAEIFLRFLCGLSDSSARSMLESHVGGFSAEASRHAISWIQRKTKEQKPDKSIRGSRDLLNAFYCLHESGNKELVLQCIGSKRVIDFSGITLTSVDCSVLSFILESCRETEHLNLKGCNVQNEGLRKLLPALHTIRSLSFYNNNLTDSSCTDLASGIRNNKALRRLDLSWNHMEGPHFRDLMTALTTSQIEELILYGNNLTESSSIHLGSGIRNNQTLRTLDLSGNNLEGPHFRDLMEALPTSRIEELHLYGSRLTDSSCTHLASGIRNNQTLRGLGLSGNNLEGPHFSDLMTALTTSRIEELLLNDNHLTDSSCPLLASGIRNNQTLSKLHLCRNNLEGPHFRDLMTALTTSRIEELFLNSNNMKSSSCTHLALGIRNNQTLKRFDLSYNNLEGPHFDELMIALTTSRIEELLLYGNKMSDSSCTHLVLGIRNNQTLKKLDLSNKNLGGPHFSDLMTALTKSRIEELMLRNVNLTDEYAPFLVSLSNCTTLTVLDLRYNRLTDASAEHVEDLILSSYSLKEVRTNGNGLSIDAEDILRNIQQEIQDYVPLNPSKSGDQAEALLEFDPPAESEEEPENLVTPIVDGKTYRLKLEPGRLFCCKETGIMFKVKSEVTITYELKFESDYVNKIQENEYDIVGPMFNITVEPKVVSEVYLPHYLCLQGLKRGISLIRCGHFKDGKFNIIKPVTIGPSHIVVENPSFSSLVALFLKLWRRPIPFKGKILLYSKVVCPEDVTCLEYKFHLYVIPKKQPEIKKLHQQKQTNGFKDMEKPHIMKSRLYTKTDYSVKVQPDGKITPRHLQLKINYETEDLPFVEVIANRNAKELVLFMSEKESDDSLWEGDITEGELREMQLRARASVSSAGSSPTTRHFVDEHRIELIDGVHPIDPVLDRLRDLELLTPDQCNIVTSKPTRQDRMRELYEFVRGWGNEDKDKLLHILEETNKSLMRRLRRQ
ncbi:NACHT, LRR and PYD domains-containing protein 12-like isoform X2 [Aquarana catesbeiana]|uniref:NACHT, LRR and PYD domains-containing protein 12-like isoform X2 n=1 Tax=Aquarana catesbeiana TaxID=8400 RepID=UPI003CCA5E86